MTNANRDTIETFRAWLEQAAADGGFGPASRHDREDGSASSSRFEAGNRAWFEMTLRPRIPQVRVALVTDDRWKSEGLEQAIEDSGDSMSEFIEAGFDDAGLEWPDPVVEHYREAGRYFYFATPLEFDSLDQLDEPSFREKVFNMLQGYRAAFAEALGSGPAK